MTIPDEVSRVAIPLKHAVICVTCEAVTDERLFRDTSQATCRDHVWCRLSIWVPPMEDDEVKT